MKLLRPLYLTILILLFFYPKEAAAEDKTYLVQKFLDYEIHFSYDYKRFPYNFSDEITFFIIYKNGKPIFKHIPENDAFGFKVMGSDQHESHLKIGNDITGDGKPNVVIKEYTGTCAYCPVYYHVFDISDNFRKIALLSHDFNDVVCDDFNFENGSAFKNIDNRPGLEFITMDWTFQFWGDQRIFPPCVILGYQNGKYELRKDLMCNERRGLSLEDKISLFKGYTDEINDSNPGESAIENVGYLNDLRQEMIEFIFNCRSEDAFALLECIFVDHPDKKKAFLDDFYKNFSKSPYSKEFNLPEKEEYKEFVKPGCKGQ